jgi:putative transposase
MNHKRVSRLYCQEGVLVRQRRRKRIALTTRPPVRTPTQPRQHWAMDFTQDSFANGRRFRTLNLVDRCTRAWLAIEVDTSLPAARVVRVLNQVIATYGRPASIRSANGPEFAGKVLDAWAYQVGVQLDFIRPGKPTENGHVERCNGKFRDECLHQHWFLSLADARRIIAAWRHDYNNVRPHSAIGYQTPSAFAKACAGAATPAL